MADTPTPRWLIEIAIEPKTSAEREKLRAALASLTMDDPALGVLKGMSEQHLDAAINHLRHAHDLDINIGELQVAYRETIMLKGSPPQIVKKLGDHAPGHRSGCMAARDRRQDLPVIRRVASVYARWKRHPTARGRSSGTLQSRRDQMQAPDNGGDAAIIRAVLPLANMFGRSLSRGCASFTMRFDHYRPVPSPDDNPPFAPAVGIRA